MAVIGNFLNPSIVKLELRSSGQIVCGAATGFLLKHQEQWFLLTSWHVLAGSHPQTGQSLHFSGAMPDQCIFRTARVVGDKLGWVTYEYPLGDAANGKATWFQHPTEGQSVDIAALPVGTDSIGLAKDILDPTGHDADMWIDLGQDLFIPGYPLGIVGNGGFAIWKRASLASSTEFGDGIRRFVHVDTATREGMSGAPCFAIERGEYYRLERRTGHMLTVNRKGAWRWLGVYSGRFNVIDGHEAQIGQVWRSELALEVVGARSPGKIVLRPET